MGTNFTSLFAYYLASPSNWFVALFPQKYTIEIMNAFIILKIAGSSLSLTYYLTKHNNNKHVIAAICSMVCPDSLRHTAGILCGLTVLF